MDFILRPIQMLTVSGKATPFDVSTIPLTPAQQQAVTQFLAEGGGVLVFVGARAETEMAFYNDQLYRGGVGLVLAIAVGAVLGIAMAWWRPANALLSPLVEMFYPMPKSALIPVTVIWLGFGDGSKILLIFLGCMLPVTIGAFNGARGSDRVLVWSARSMGASRLRMLWDVVVPSAMPSR